MVTIKSKAWIIFRKVASGNFAALGRISYCQNSTEVNYKIAKLMDLDITNTLSLLAWERCYLFLCVNKALHYRNKVKEESQKNPPTKL